MTTMYAKVIDNKVVAVATAEVKQSDNSGQGQWIETDSNMVAGRNLSGGALLRKNFAVVGGTYDPAKDAFISPQPYVNWTLNSDTCAWEPPVALPTRDQLGQDHIAVWNVAEQKFDIVSIVDHQDTTGIVLPVNTLTN